METKKLTSEEEQFFHEHRIDPPPTPASRRTVMKYIVKGNNTKGITPARRAELFRDAQERWNGKRVRYYHEDVCGSVRYLVIGQNSERGFRQIFHAVVDWDRPLTGNVNRTTIHGVNVLVLLDETPPAA